MGAPTRQLVEKLASFNGKEDPTAWLKELKMVGKWGGFGDEEMIRVATLNMSGEARAWGASQTFVSFEQFEEKLMKSISQNA